MPGDRGGRAGTEKGEVEEEREVRVIQEKEVRQVVERWRGEKGVKRGEDRIGLWWGEKKLERGMGFGENSEVEVEGESEAKRD